MTSRTPVAVWCLLYSLLFSICLCYAPPLSSIHEINTRGKQEDQIITRKEEIISRGKGGVDRDGRQTMEVFSPLTLYYHKWKNRDGDDLDLKRVHSSLSTHPHQPTLPTRGRKVGIKWNVDNSRTTSNITTIPPFTTATTTTTTTTATMIYPFISSSLNHPPSPLLPLSSCFSPACKWLASWQFIVVVCMTLAWLVGLMTLYCMTRTTRGKALLEAWSSLCTHDEQDQDEVTTKGIGYLDGSPGLRRFVLIEDEKDEENDMDDLSTAEFQEVESKENKEEERGDGNPKRMKPPRRGTYILQEASKKGVLEVGTYRIQEKEEEEEEEVDGKRKDNDKEEEEVEYILEGATYILQSERVERGDTGLKRGEERGGYIGGIEGLYGIIGREKPQGEGYRGLGGLRVYGFMGRGEAEGIRGGGGRYGRIEGIEGLYEILHGEVSGGGGDRREGDDGILLSMGELVEAVRRGKEEEKIRGESMSGEGRTGAKGEEWRKVGGGGDAGGGWGEVGEGGREERGKVRGKGTSGSKRGKGGKLVDEKEREKVNVTDTWGGRKVKAAKTNSTGGGEGSCRANTPPSPKRAASFPMDHFLSSHLMPRKLSLIVEEDIH